MIRSDHLELIDAGEHAWRVSDTRVPADSPSYIVASIDVHDRDYEVLWIRGAIAAPGSFHTLAGALHAIDHVVATRA